MKKFYSNQCYKRWNILSLFAACTMLFFSGCEGFSLSSALPETDEKNVGKYDFKEHLDKPMDSNAGTTDNHDITTSTDKENSVVPKEALQKVNDNMSDISAAKTDSITANNVNSKRREVNFYDDLILLDAEEELSVSLIFNSTPIVDVLPAFADLLGFNYEADSAISGNVNLNINSTMTRKQLWECFDRILRLAGATAVADGDILAILPLNKMPAVSPLRTDGKGIETLEILSRTLKYTNVATAAEQLKSFITASGTIIQITDGNIILVSDMSDNIAKLNEILTLIDNPGRSQWPRAVIPCRNIKPSALATELSEILPVIGFEVAVGNNANDNPAAIHLTGIDRLQLVIASAATGEAVEEIRNWVNILDNTDPSSQERIYVYKVANGKADQLAQALSVIFTTQGTSLTIDTDTGNDRTSQLSTANNRNQSTASRDLVGSVTNNLANTETDISSDLFSAPVRIFADGVYNRLVIRATPRTYAMVKALLDKLDSVPAQVLLQIMIVEVSLDDSTEFGMEFSYTENGTTTQTILGSNFESLSNTNMPNGYSFTLQDMDDPTNKFATIRALAGRNNVKIISSPQLLVTSNTKAYIQIGNQVPLLSSDYTDVDSAGTTQRSYNYEDTGIILTITPQVTSTNLIALEIDQEISEAVKNTITSASDTPVIQKRQMTTAMTIANGKTMIIGGMIEEKIKDNNQGLPIIADIPILGQLFGHTVQSVERVELLVLVTGYIVSEQSPIEDMIRRYDESVRTLSEFETNLSKLEEK